MCSCMPAGQPTCRTYRSYAPCHTTLGPCRRTPQRPFPALAASAHSCRRPPVLLQPSRPMVLCLSTTALRTTQCRVTSHLMPAPASSCGSRQAGMGIGERVAAHHTGLDGLGRAFSTHSTHADEQVCLFLVLSNLLQPNVTLEQLDAICSELEDALVTSRFSGLCLTSDVGAGRAACTDGEQALRARSWHILHTRPALSCRMTGPWLLTAVSGVALFPCSTRQRCRQRQTRLPPSPGASSPSLSRARSGRAGGAQPGC